MRGWQIAVAAAACLAAAAVIYFHDNPVHAAMERDLFEPDTAGWTYSRPATAAKGWLAELTAPPVICGQVSGRTHRGIYSGNKEFILDRRSGATTYQTDVMLEAPRYRQGAREQKFMANWHAACELGAMNYAQIRQAFDWERGTGPYLQ